MSRDRPGTLGSQIEDQLRCAIRDGTLRPGARVPSTRDLAHQLGVSRRVVVDAYAQLAAEGYLSLRQGARPRVSDAAAVPRRAARRRPTPRPAPPRFDFRPSVPDVSRFPRAAWLRSLREALQTMTDAELGYGDARGVDALRAALADYLGRVRGVVADAGRSRRDQRLLAGPRADLPGARGDRRQARSRSRTRRDPEQHRIARAGRDSTPSRSPSTTTASASTTLARADVDAVIVTPAHQHPTGVVLSGERRTRAARLAARPRRDRDRGRLRRRVPLRPGRRRRAAGARARPRRLRRLGEQDAGARAAARLARRPAAPRWRPCAREKRLADHGTARIEQHAFADFLARGELDRHLRRMRARYRSPPRRARRRARRGAPRGDGARHRRRPARDGPSSPRATTSAHAPRRPAAAASSSGR